MDWKNVPDQAKLRTERARRIWKAPGASTGVNCLRLTHNGTALSMGLSDGSVAVLLLEAIRAPPGKQATCTAAAAAPPMYIATESADSFARGAAHALPR